MSLDTFSTDLLARCSAGSSVLNSFLVVLILILIFLSFWLFRKYGINIFVLVDFYINERGEVENPVIRDTFNIALNEVVLDKVRQASYYPAVQNGRPVRIKFTLPIVFK